MPNIWDDGDDDTQPNNSQYSSIDPDVIRTIIGEGDPASVASVLANRKKKTGVDYTTLISDPTQFEARTGDAWKQNSQISTDDPRYQKALAVAGPILTGQVKPVTDADSFYSPDRQSALGRPKPPMDDGSGVKGPDGQLYFTGKYSRSPSIWDDSDSEPAEADTTPTIVKPPVDNVALDSATDNAANSPGADDTKSWPVYDPYTNVGRNKDGSIAYIGKPNPAPYHNSKGELVLRITNSSNPDSISAWLKDHPNDIANKGYKPFSDQSTNPVLSGLSQGIRNVGDSVAGVAAPLSPDLQQALTKNLLDRQTNDVNNQGNLGYNLGKFGGELLGSAPLLAIPGADAGIGAGLGSGLLRYGSLAAKGALQGGEAAALTSAGSNQSLGQQVGTGALTGAVAAPVLSAAGSTLSKYINLTVPNDIGKLANRANQFGIDLDTPQIKGAINDRNYTPSPGGRIVNPKTQSTQSLQAVGSTFGADPDVIAKEGLTPQVVEAQRKIIGQNINTARSQLELSDPNDLDNLFTNLDNVRANINSNMSSSDSKALRDIIKNINIQVTRNNGKFDGDSYHSLTTQGGPLQKLLNSKDTNVQRYAGDIKEAIDNAFEKTNQPASNAFRVSKTQYKNLKSVEDKVPFYQHDGIGLMQDIGRNNTQFYGTQGDPGDLANIGRIFYNRGVKPKFGPKSLLSGGLVGAGELGFVLGNPSLALKVAPSEALLGAAAWGANKGIKALQSNSINRQIAGKPIYDPTLSYLSNKFSAPAVALIPNQGTK